MNYYIEKHDMEIILDALELLQETIKNKEALGLKNDYVYSKEDVDGLFQSFDLRNKLYMWTHEHLKFSLKVTPLRLSKHKMN